MKKSALALTILCFVGCSHPRTGYHEVNQYGGYSQADVTEYLMKARFSGNAYTNASDSSVFAQFRAIEVCQELGFKFARIYGVDDLTQTKSVQRSYTYTSQDPVNFKGNYNSQTRYNRYNGANGAYETQGNASGTFSGGDSQSSTSTWFDTYHLPTFDAYFNCSNSPKVIGVRVVAKSAAETQGLTKDLLGALQVADIDVNSENASKFQRGDLILKIGGTRVDNIPLFNVLLDGMKKSDEVSIVLLREGQQLSFRVKMEDSSKILADSNSEITYAACMVPEVASRPICRNRVPAGQ